MRIIQSGNFRRAVKKQHPSEKLALDRAVKAILENSKIGIRKKGDLVELRVYKYNVSNQQYLPGYRYNDEAGMIALAAIGPHENFYRDIKW